MATKKRAPKISQREAIRLRKRVAELEYRLRDLKHHHPDGDRIRTVTVSEVSYEATRIAKLLGRAVVVELGDWSKNEIHLKAVKVD